MEISDSVLIQIITEAQKSKGWLKFLGIVLIVAGGLQALSIVGILFAWLPIWMGALLVQAGNLAAKISTERDMNALPDLMSKLRAYFTIQAIVIVASIVVAILIIILYVIFGLALFAMLSQEMN